EEVDLEDISQVQDIVLHEKLFSITHLISNIETLNDNPTPDRVFNSFESDNSLLDNFSPKFETFCDHSEETRSGDVDNLVENDNSDSSNDPFLEEVDLFLFDNLIPPSIENVTNDPEGDIRFLEELLIDDSILSHESFDSNFEDNPSISRPPPEPPDDSFDLKPECHRCGQPCDGYYCESCMCPQCGMTLFNGICDNCIYGAGMPIICTACGGIVRGGLCLPCDLREKDLYNYDPNAYSFDTSNYFPQPQDENYLCNLCGNNSHDGYDCQQQFLFVYEQEPSYNQNYNDNYYLRESLSFLCCDYCGGSHETFQCQPDNQNIEFSGSDQIQTLQYPDVNPPSPEISNEENFQAKGDLMKSIQTFLERFNCIPFEEKPQILFQTWETFFAIQCSQPEDSNDLFQKLLRELKELAEYDQSTKVPEEQKQKMEDTMLDLVKNCHHKQFLFMHDNVDDLIESALDSKLLSINSINSKRLDKKEQEVKIIEDECEVTLEDKRECDELICDNSSTVCNNHFDILFDSNNDDLSSDDESFEDIEYVDASVPDPAIVSVEEENVVQQEEEEVDLEDISQVQDVVLREKLFSITRLISNIETLNNNSTPDCVFNSFESDNSLLDNFSPEFETFCDHSKKTRSGNTTHANYSLLEYDSFCFEIDPDQERLINLVENDVPDNSSNDPLLEEVDLFLFDDSIPPGIKNVVDDPEGDIHFLEELLISDSILSHESPDSNFEDNPSISRPPPEPPDDNFDLEPEVISAVMEDIDEPDEHFNPGGEIFVSTKIEDDDYFSFMFVIRFFLPYLIIPEISPLFLSAESEDMIFDP
nr:hypothetical protein [Tanacetum cinerariifolium]